MTIKLINNNKEKLTELCRKYGVVELDVFGSAATDDFDRTRSDIDFLIIFGDDVKQNRFDNFFNLRQELERLFHTDIDLVEPGGLKNPYFKRMVNNTRKTVYAAS